MNTHDNIEKILRNLHVLLSKSEPYEKMPSKVIVDKQLMLDLLTQLNKSVYDMMDEYELTKQSRDRAEREFKKKGNEIIADANYNAEDIYAASVMYTDETLNYIQNIIKDATISMENIYAEMNKKLKEEQKNIRTNQLELKAQLRDLKDTEKYLKLIEDRNREIQKEKENTLPLEEREVNIYANRQTDIKINQEYLDKLGISLEDDADEIEEPKKIEAPKIRVDLKSEYFQRKEGQENKSKISPEKAERFQKILKEITSGKSS